jgi:hypothetical protein
MKIYSASKTSTPNPFSNWRRGTPSPDGEGWDEVLTSDLQFEIKEQHENKNETDRKIKCSMP